MKIVIIGGSAFSTPGLLRFLSQEKCNEKMEVVLASRSQTRLDATGRASKMAGSDQIAITSHTMTNDTWQTILDGADCILVQIRVGGYGGRLFDETFPHKYGLCGDEGLGPGGLSAGWRTWPAIVNILEAIAKFSPHSLVVMLTSPLGMLVRASLGHADLKVVGICELPWTTLQKLSHSLGRRPDELQADYFGINHIGWFFNIRSSSSEELIDDLARAIGNDAFPSGDLLRTHRCVPTPYLRLHYETKRAIGEQMSQKMQRAEVLGDIQEQAYSVYEKGAAAEIESVLDRRATPWYSEAVGPLILGLAGCPIKTPLFLSNANGTYTATVAPDDVIETAYRCSDQKLLRIPLSGALPHHVANSLLPFVEYERMASKAITSRSVPLLVDALSVHPWTRDHADLESIANEIAFQNYAVGSPKV